jgi:TrmH family RNA methyltransferase
VPVRLEGFHAVKHALRFAPELVGAVDVTDLAAARALAEQLAPDVTALLLARAVVAAVDHPTGVQALARRPDDDRSVLQRRSSPLLLLDRPRHPGNAGAAVRVAAAASACGVALTGDLDPWHPAVLRGSAGLHYALPVLRTEPHEVTGPVLVLDAEGEPLRTVPDDAVVALPMRAGVSSLNLATAAAAALYAWRLAQGTSPLR